MKRLIFLLTLTACGPQPQPGKPPKTSPPSPPPSECVGFLSADCLVKRHPPGHEPPDDKPIAPPGYEPPKEPATQAPVSQ